MPAPAEARQSQPAEAPERRIVALVLPALLCELAEPRRIQGQKRLPLGVVLEEVEKSEPLASTAVLGAVNEEAQRLGVRVGQTLAEARAFSARLQVQRVTQPAVEEALGHLAEVALGFGATVAYTAPDTVWVDVSGAAHLFGGEAALLAELVGRVREIGHRVRAAVAPGPNLAQAFARFGDLGPEGFVLIPQERLARELARLPVRALALPTGIESWLIRLGVLTLAELGELPESSLAARLEQHAPRVFAFMAGRDNAPLAAYTPAETLVEASSWDEPVSGSEPLLFVLRGLSARIAARLGGRGQAARSLALELVADSVVARFRGTARQQRIEISLPKPLWKSEEIQRVVASKLERIELKAPSVGLRLEVTELVEAMPRQLELGLWGATDPNALDELPIVLAELTADLGEERVGVLRLVDSHRPELSSELVPALAEAGAKSRGKKGKTRRVQTLKVTRPENTQQLVHRMSRLLKEPVPLEAPLRVGATLALGRRLYTISQLRFVQRLEAVEWWSGAVNRDYVHVGLQGIDGFVEGLIYVDRESGKRYWQAAG